ncbi:MAG: PDZ domain-containing protein [Alphaproteobacteria bacterium]|nr:PDZ domain-containing protein [Alphaproteobacteria bacterium]
MKRTIFAILFFLVGFTLAVGLSSVTAQEQRTAGAKPVYGVSDTYRELNLFGDVFDVVRGQYVDPVEDKKLIENALNGMLTSLDAHSAYLNEDDFEDMRVQTRGEFGGLGIEVTMEEGLVKVVSPIDDTPAARAGMQAGDFVLQIDDTPIMGLKLNEAVDKMRGKVGTSVTLLVRREGVNEPMTFKLVRDVIRIQSVKSRVEGGDVGYIRITTFNQNTDEGLRRAVEDIRKKLGKNLVGYVLDLRNNPGGLLDQAIAVSDEFLEKGEIVSTRGRNERDTKRDNATPGDITEGAPIVILINGGSASASEIVAGAMQDHKRAILLGVQSFGKGSVQTVIPVSDHGALRMTTARYYTPSGRSIQAKGITPDIKVEQAKIEELTSKSIKESDLNRALKNPQSAEEAKEQSKAENAAISDEAKNDYQLSRALDLLRGVNLYRQGKEQS